MRSLTAPPKLLIFTASYNERGNIGSLIEEIISTVRHADILVVDDNSPDGTFDVVLEKQKTYPQIKAVRRQRKLGLATAHKYALLYAIRQGYDALITMDADWSHHPKYIPTVLQALAKNTFVAGSRYCEGGSCDYTGFRKIVSRFGNFIARHLLSVGTHDLTTSFRAFNVDDLHQLPLRHVHGSDYSYGIQLSYHLRKSGVTLREVPIHFTDPARRASKIPRLQVLLSAWDLFVLAAKRFNRYRELGPDQFVPDACPGCGDQVLALKHFGNRKSDEAGETPRSVAAYRCTSVTQRSYPPVYTCVNCGLQQVPASVIPRDLEQLYQDVVDEQYLNNIEARERTFRRLFDQIATSLPKAPGRMLEVGAYCGLFAREAMRRGWQVDAVEPSAWAAKYARETLGVNVYAGFLTDNRYRLGDEYDVVVSWDVLEHVRDPLQFVGECREYLAPGGILCFSTLDVDTWFPRLLRLRWPWLMDMHLYYFDRHVVRTLLSRAGFELLRAETYVHYAFVKYALRSAARSIPTSIGNLANKLIALIPTRAIVPVGFGDVKVYIAYKLDVVSSVKPAPAQPRESTIALPPIFANRPDNAVASH